tara:strand:+ start:66 stop:851 length:786 start_codon:yes stop_codon:yes gene_type:complete
MNNTKILSWNINGIRAGIKKGFIESMESINPDIICIQETKASCHQVEPILSDYKYQYWNSAEKKGYSGTAIFSKIEPINVACGIDEYIDDNEGRVITLEFNNYYLVTVYTPNSKRDLSRLDYRYNNWDPSFLKYVKNLEKYKPVVFCGDLNVAHNEIDLANPKTNKTKNSFPGNAGFTNKERERFNDIVNADFIDTFRFFNDQPEHYTWWSYMRQARDRNIGWRIDYFCVSISLKKQLISSTILPDIMGSDHAPILLELAN